MYESRKLIRLQSRPTNDLFFTCDIICVANQAKNKDINTNVALDKRGVHVRLSTVLIGMTFGR